MCLTKKFEKRAQALEDTFGVSRPFTDEESGNITMIKYTGLWDTGAMGSVVSSKVAKELGLIPTGKKEAHTANGSAIQNEHLVHIQLPNNHVIPNVFVTEANLHGIDVLIGMDIIGCGDFSITQPNGLTTLSFRIPSCKEIDYQKESKDHPVNERRLAHPLPDPQAVRQHADA